LLTNVPPTNAKILSNTHHLLWWLETWPCLERSPSFRRWDLSYIYIHIYIYYMFVCLFSSQNSFSGNVRGFPIQSNLSVCRSEKKHEFKCSRNGFRCFRCSKSI
jgi:hypothetical protein